jgi:hypothetical protein
VCRDFFDTLGNTCGSSTPRLEVLHQDWFVVFLCSKIVLETGLTGFGSKSGLKFLISADSSIDPPLDDIKILSRTTSLKYDTNVVYDTKMLNTI